MRFTPVQQRLGLIVCLASVLWLGEYFRRGLWEPDEARYAYIAREMHQSGEWFTPQRHGEYYSHKPPLMFWLINAASLLTGGQVNQVSARLPSLLGAILALSAVWGLARRHGTPEVAWWAVLLCATSLRFWHQGGWGQIDMLLCGLQMVAVWQFFAHAMTPAAWRLIVAFSAMGLAVLAKGPVGLIIPVGIYVCGMCAAGDSRRLLRWHWIWGLLLTAAFPSLWLLLSWLSGASPAYFRELIFTQNVDRAVGQFGGHVRPWYYYVTYVLTDFLPWALFLPLAARVHFATKGAARKGLNALLGWMAFVLVFFSLLNTKRGLYILMVYPAASIYLASTWSRFRDLPPRWRRLSRILFMALLLGGAVVSVGAAFYPALPIHRWPLVILGIGLGGGALGLCLRKAFSTQWLKLAVAIVFVAEVFIGAALLPEINRHKSPVFLKALAQRCVATDQPVLLFRENGEILAFYAERPGRRIDTVDALQAEMAAQGRGLLLYRSHESDDLQAVVGASGESGSFRVGNKHFIWLTFVMNASE